MVSVSRGTNRRTVNVADNHNINTNGYDSDGVIGSFFDVVVDELNVFDNDVGSGSERLDPAQVSAVLEEPETAPLPALPSRTQTAT